VDKGFIHLVGPDAAAAIEGEVPGDANQPDAHVAHGGEGEAMLDDAEEDVLDDVFGLGAAAQDGVGDAKEEHSVGRDQRGQIDLGLDGMGSGTLRGGRCQAEVLDRGYVAHLLGQTGDGGIRSGIFGGRKYRGLSPAAGRYAVVCGFGSHVSKARHGAPEFGWADTAGPSTPLRSAQDDTVMEWTYVCRT
jgi:hypothetical protein